MLVATSEAQAQEKEKKVSSRVSAMHVSGWLPHGFSHAYACAPAMARKGKGWGVD